MGLFINTNTSSLVAQRNLTNSSNDLNRSLQRLSSGLRINSARDDAAGLGISTRLTSQIGGLDQAIRNANDAISLAQTAEGALQETTNLLQRMRDLSVQSANDTNSSSDRANIQKEVQQLKTEVDRIASTTRFSGVKLLDGSFTNAKFQVGAFAGETLSLSISSASGSRMGSYQATTDSAAGDLADVTANGTSKVANNAVATNLTVTGATATQTAAIAVGNNESAKSIADKVQTQSSTTGVNAEAKTTATFGGVSADGAVTFNLYGSNSTAVEVSATVTTTDLGTLADAINSVSNQTGVTAVSNGSSIALSSDEGYDIAIENYVNGTAGNQTATLQGSSATTTLTEAANDSATVGGIVTFSSSNVFTVQSDNATGNIQAAASQSAALSSVTSISVDSQSGAESAIKVIDDALAVVDDIRSTLGAVQNRLTSTISNLGNISNNASAARSQIRDADFATETASLTKAQILQQAGVSILAQANASSQGALALLQ